MYFVKRHNNELTKIGHYLKSFQRDSDFQRTPHHAYFSTFHILYSQNAIVSFQYVDFFAKKLIVRLFKKSPNCCVMDSPIFDPFIERLNETTKLTKFVRWIICLNLALLRLKLLFPNFFNFISQYSFSNYTHRQNVWSGWGKFP